MTTQQQRAKVRSEALAPDGLSRFIGAGAWGAMVSGLAMAISFLMEWVVVPPQRLGPEAFVTSSYLVSSVLRLLGIVLLPWALLSIYERQSRPAGTFGLLAFAVGFLGTVLTVGDFWAEVFVWPTLA